MEGFNTLYRGEWVSLVSPQFSPYEALHEEQDLIVVIPVDLENELVWVRKEWCPPYAVKSKTDERMFYTVVTGGIEKGESVEDACLREVEEECGLIFDSEEGFKLIPLTLKSIPFMKATTQRVSVFALDIKEYKETEPLGDGTENEAKSETLKLSFKELSQIGEDLEVDFLLEATLALLLNNLLF